MKYICKVCGEEFDSAAAHALYCTPQCKEAARRERYLARYYSNEEASLRQCKLCGDLFTTKNPEQVLCGHECSRAWILKHKKEEYNAWLQMQIRLSPKCCKECGEMYLPKSKGSKYCSDACRKEGGRKIYNEHKRRSRSKGGGMVTTDCEGCGITFTSLRVYEHTHCAKCRARIARGTSLEALSSEEPVKRESKIEELNKEARGKNMSYGALQAEKYKEKTGCGRVTL